MKDILLPLLRMHLVRLGCIWWKQKARYFKIFNTFIPINFL